MSLKSRIRKLEEKILPEPELKTKVHKEGIDGPLPPDWGKDEDTLYIIVRIGD